MRKVIQIAYGESIGTGSDSYPLQNAKLIALCDDGALFEMPVGEYLAKWTRIPGVPQDEEQSE